MADDLELAPPHHRKQLAGLLADLRHLQGRSTCPREHKVYRDGSTVYTVRMFAYPLGLTATHLSAVEKMPAVTDVCVNFSLAGNHPEARGALCVRVVLGDERAAADDDDGARSVKRRKDEPADAPGWMDRLWG